MHCASGFAIASSFTVLILAAVVINFTSNDYYGRYYTFGALGIATSSLTLLTLPVMLLYSANRKGAFTSMISVEVAWTCEFSL